MSPIAIGIVIGFLLAIVVTCVRAMSKVRYRALTDSDFEKNEVVCTYYTKIGAIVDANELLRDLYEDIRIVRIADGALIAAWKKGLRQ